MPSRKPAKMPCAHGAEEKATGARRPSLPHRCILFWPSVKAMGNSKSVDLFFVGSFCISFAILCEGFVRYMPVYFGSGFYTASAVLWVRRRLRGQGACASGACALRPSLRVALAHQFSLPPLLLQWICASCTLVLNVLIPFIAIYYHSRQCVGWQLCLRFLWFLFFGRVLGGPMRGLRFSMGRCNGSWWGGMGLCAWLQQLSRLPVDELAGGLPTFPPPHSPPFASTPLSFKDVVPVWMVGFVPGLVTGLVGPIIAEYSPETACVRWRVWPASARGVNSGGLHGSLGAVAVGGGHRAAASHACRRLPFAMQPSQPCWCSMHPLNLLPCCRQARHIVYMSYLLLGFSFPVLMMGVTIVLAKLLFFGERCFLVRHVDVCLCGCGRVAWRVRWPTGPTQAAQQPRLALHSLWSTQAPVCEDKRSVATVCPPLPTPRLAAAALCDEPAVPHGSPGADRRCLRGADGGLAKGVHCRPQAAALPERALPGPAALPVCAEMTGEGVVCILPPWPCRQP